MILLSIFLNVFLIATMVGAYVMARKLDRRRPSRRVREHGLRSRCRRPVRRETRRRQAPSAHPLSRTRSVVDNPLIHRPHAASLRPPSLPGRALCQLGAGPTPSRRRRRH
jgi:hypothetical protein